MLTHRIAVTAILYELGLFVGAVGTVFGVIFAWVTLLDEDFWDAYPSPVRMAGVYVVEKDARGLVEQESGDFSTGTACETSWSRGTAP